MDKEFFFSQFKKNYPDEDACIEEIKRIKFSNGIYCRFCKKQTRHYKLKNRTAYSCKFCRNHIYPLKDTIFEKTTTPLRIWFYAIFLMTQTRADLSIKQLERELNVTYKTSWRIYKNLKYLMEQNNGDLLTEKYEKIFKWTFLNKLELKVVQKTNSTG